MNNMLTVEEVKSYLDINQDDFEKFLKQGKVHAYKIGGTYIRFRKEEVVNLRYNLKPKSLKKPSKTFFSHVGDFWRFNNFYIISLMLVTLIIVWMVRY